MRKKYDFVVIAIIHVYCLKQIQTVLSLSVEFCISFALSCNYFIVCTMVKTSITSCLAFLVLMTHKKKSIGTP